MGSVENSGKSTGSARRFSKSRFFIYANFIVIHVMIRIRNGSCKKSPVTVEKKDDKSQARATAGGNNKPYKMMKYTEMSEKSPANTYVG